MSRAQGWRRAIAPATIAIACALPFLLSNFRLFQFTQVGIYAIALLGLNILTGYNGQISLGHGAFYALGAYTTAIMIDKWNVAYGWTIPVAGLLCLAVGFLFGPVSGTFVAEALLIAFAIEFPDYEVLLLILPVKVKYLGILSGALMIYELATGDLAARAAVAVAVADLLLFCGSTLRSRLRGAGVTRRKATPAFAPPARKARVCAKCGRSDADDPNLEFRVCDCQEKCRGKLTEYCLEHARAH